MIRPLVASMLLLSACNAHPEIVGPFTGSTQRFVVDSLTLPRDDHSFRDDLNGDGRLDNQLANVVNFLLGGTDLTDATDDLIASGVLASVVEITSDDPALEND